MGSKGKLLKRSDFMGLCNKYGAILFEMILHVCWDVLQWCALVVSLQAYVELKRAPIQPQRQKFSYCCCRIFWRTLKSAYAFTKKHERPCCSTHILICVSSHCTTGILVHVWHHEGLNKGNWYTLYRISVSCLIGFRWQQRLLERFFLFMSPLVNQNLPTRAQTSVLTQTTTE